MKATATAQGMRIVPYTTKSFAVVGETYNHRDELKAMGGAFSKWLKIDGVNAPGWCFSLKREIQVRQWLKQVDNPRPAPKDKKAKPKATKRTATKKAATVDITELVAKEVARLMAQRQTPAAPEKPAIDCTKENVARALAGEPVSAYHWAMRHVLEWGLQPSEVSKGTGLFGYDRHGNPFGESERRSVFWMLNSKSSSADLACAEDCPEHLRSNASEQLFWDIVQDFAGPGGKSRLVEKCIELSESTVTTPECPF